MSETRPASGRGSVFRGIAGRLAVVAAAFVLLASPGLAQQPPQQPQALEQQDAPQAAAATTAPAPAAAGPGGAVPGHPASPHQTQAMTAPYPHFVPPRMLEPVAIAACRSCRENCFKDYGGPCADETCARALPLCMRNCWHAVCR